MTDQTRSTQQAESAGRKKSILVVVDHPTIQDLVVTSLTLAGYHCSSVVAQDVASFSWVENMVSSVPDGIVMDVDCRSDVVRDPSDFLSQFCARWQTAFRDPQMPPMLLLTTQPEALAASERECYAVLQKPFPLQLLLKQMILLERQQEECGGAHRSENGSIIIPERNIHIWDKAT